MVRLKHRYLLVNLLYPDASRSSTTGTSPSSKDLPSSVQFQRPTADELTPQILLRMLRDTTNELFGDYGSGMVSGSLVIKYLSPATSTAIIRVTRQHYRLVWAALTYMTKLPRPVEQDVVFQVVRVSGTIRKSEEEAIRRAKASILKAHTAEGKSGGDLLARLLKDDAGNVDTGHGKRGIVDDDDDEDDDMDDDD